MLESHQSAPWCLGLHEDSSDISSRQLMKHLSAKIFHQLKIRAQMLEMVNCSEEPIYSVQSVY